MKRLLVVSSFPAPYRVAVFRGLAKWYRVDVFFEMDADQNRNQNWFENGQDFQVLTNEKAKADFAACLEKIRDYDLVLAYDYLNPNARRAMRCCLRNRVPYCVNCDGAFINHHPVKDLIKHYYVSRALACFASGRFAREYFLHYGARPERIYEHGFTSLAEADLLPLSPSPQEKRALREELGLDPDRPVVLTIGQFIPRKGFDLLLAAWKETDDRAQLLLIGGGDGRQGYLDTIAESGLSHVTVLDFMEKEKLYRYYRAADLFVLPTREDIWGLVINEAMACGLPVVSTDRCIAAMELVEEGKGGYLVPAGDVPALADVLKKALADPQLLRQMGENNRKKMKNYTLERIVESHREVIEKIV